MVMNDTKICQKMKKKFVEYRKKQQEEKRFLTIIRNYYFLESNDLEKSFDGEQIKSKCEDALKNQF